MREGALQQGFALGSPADAADGDRGPQGDHRRRHAGRRLGRVEPLRERRDLVEAPEHDQRL